MALLLALATHKTNTHTEIQQKTFHVRLRYCSRAPITWFRSSLPDIYMVFLTVRQDKQRHKAFSRENITAHRHDTIMHGPSSQPAVPALVMLSSVSSRKQTVKQACCPEQRGLKDPIPLLRWLEIYSPRREKIWTLFRKINPSQKKQRTNDTPN